MLSLSLVTGRFACSDLWLGKLRKETKKIKFHPVKKLYFIHPQQLQQSRNVQPQGILGLEECQ